MLCIAVVAAGEMCAETSVGRLGRTRPCGAADTTAQNKKEIRSRMNFRIMTPQRSGIGTDYCTRSVKPEGESKRMCQLVLEPLSHDRGINSWNFNPRGNRAHHRPV